MGELFKEFLYIVSNFEDYLSIAINTYGMYIYLVLFFTVFLESASIITSFLPGDSLIFITGTLASAESLNIIITFIVLSGAAMLGDVTNYYIGKLLGKKIISMKHIRFFKKESIEKAHNFYENHGKVAIIMGRFIPVVRSFIAFIAGFSAMDFHNFMVYSTIGGLLRICLFLFSGYYFGCFRVVRENLEIAIIIVAIVTVIPAIARFIMNKLKSNN